MKKVFCIIFLINFAQLIAVADANYKDIKYDYSLVVPQYEQGQSYSFFMQKIYLYASGKKGVKKVKTDIFVLVDDRDYAYLNQWEWGMMKLYHCNNPITYARRYEWVNDKYTAVLMHRVILGLKERNEHGDHINGDTMNNQRSNLRKATHTQNMQNRAKLTKVSDSWYQGVSYNKVKNKWFASIRVNKKNTCVFCDSEINAAREYNKMAILYRGDFARINILP